MLTTITDLKAVLGITGNSDDDRLRIILEGVEAAVKRTCKRTFESTTATEYLSGNGGKSIWLEQRPVTAVTGVWVDDQGYYGGPANAFQGASDAWTEGVDYVIRRTDESEKNIGELVAIAGTGPGSGIWPKGEGNIKVTATTGYTIIPDDLIHAVHALASATYQAAKQGLIGPFQKETLGRYTYELMSSAEAAKASGNDVVTAASIIKSYREPVV